MTVHVVDINDGRIEVVQVGEQGPPGPPGAPGGGESDDYLLVTNRLSEFSTQQARTEARQNLELQYIDGGTF